MVQSAPDPLNALPNKITLETDLSALTPFARTVTRAVLDFEAFGYSPSDIGRTLVMLGARYAAEVAGRDVCPPQRVAIIAQAFTRDVVAFAGIDHAQFKEAWMAALQQPAAPPPNLKPDIPPHSEPPTSFTL